jgi:phosphatidylinositol alpha-1,6-mannosyltransferase
MAPKYLLITYDFPPAGGGISRYYQNIFRHFPARTVVVWTVRNRGKADVNKVGGIRVIRSRLDGGQVHSLLSLLFCRRELDRVIREEKPTFLLCGNIRPFGPLVRLLSRRFGIPFAVFTHGYDVARTLIKIGGNPFYSLYYRGVLRDARCIVANSSFTRDHIAAKFPSARRRIEVVHPGVDTGHFRPVSRKWKTPVLLSVGRLRERKGVDEVIRSLPRVLREYPGLIYNVVGDGEFKHELAGLVRRLGLGGSVRFHHTVSDADLRSWYDRSDIFLMVTKQARRPEDFEGFGIVYLEAAASGLPVIAAPLGGVTDAVTDGETGLLVRSGPDSIASALIRLLRDRKLRERLGRNGRLRCVRDFQWIHSARKLKRLLEKTWKGPRESL